MLVVKARNVNDAFRDLLYLMESKGHWTKSRAGLCIELPSPVTTVYLKPRERVLFAPERDANPFFHLMEALWMLAGRNDMEFITHYNRKMMDFSDDGATQHGAYGHRWRVHFGIDQLDSIVELLKENPNSRRAVIQMYDCMTDIDVTEKALKDVPCNVVLHVQMRSDFRGATFPRVLDMELFCRSNDLIWGATGANAVHFSILQEYLAARLGVEVGALYQVSCNMHAYGHTYTPISESGIRQRPFYQPYNVGIDPDRIVSVPESFDEELHAFMHGSEYGVKWHNRFFPEVAIPMKHAYRNFREYKTKKKYEMMLNFIEAANKVRGNSDWLVASRDWTFRRFKDYAAKENGNG